MKKTDKENEEKYQANKARAERRREERKKKEEEKYRKKKIKETIVMINDVVKLKIAQSDVHGVGVFAMRDIKKGDMLYANAIPNLVDVPYKDFKKLRPEIVEMILSHFPQVINGSHFMSPDTLMQMYMNHSDKPNYDSSTDKALKAIKKGEEIFEDYRKIDNAKKIFDFIK